MKSKLESFAAVVGLLAIFAVLLGYPVMLLWNWLMPDIFGLPQITFWQAIGLHFLSSALIKSSTTIKNKD